MRSWSATTAVVGLISACGPDPGPEACYGVCGAGTRCEARTCVAVAEPAEEVAEVPEPEPRRKGKGRRRRGKGSDAAPDGGEVAVVDDSNIPEYDPNANQVIDMKAGSERLSDAQVRAGIRALDPAFNACIATAAAGTDEELAGGSISLRFTIEPSGKVSSVSASAPAHLRQGGILPCVRKAVSDHRFPSFDGSPMGAESTFTVE